MTPAGKVTLVEKPLILGRFSLSTKRYLFEKRIMKLY